MTWLFGFIFVYAAMTFFYFCSCLYDWFDNRGYDGEWGEFRVQAARRSLLAPLWPYFFCVDIHKSGIITEFWNDFTKDLKGEDARN